MKKCAALLVAAIQRKLPSIDAKVKELIARKRDELRALPETTPETMRSHYQDIVREFETHFTGLLDGTTFGSDDDALHGGARIANLFEYSFQVGFRACMHTYIRTRARTRQRTRSCLVKPWRVQRPAHGASPCVCC